MVICIHVYKTKKKKLFKLDIRLNKYRMMSQPLILGINGLFMSSNYSKNVITYNHIDIIHMILENRVLLISMLLFKTKIRFDHRMSSCVSLGFFKLCSS